MVDPANFFLRNLGSVNNTIIHKCVHWEKHRMLILTCYPKTIYECNEMLLAQGLKPLGRQNRAKV